jgi:HSP20 family protein
MLRDLEALRNEVERAFEGFGVGHWSFPFSRVSFLPGRSARDYPLVNVSEDQDHVYVEALAPGLNAENLEITVLKNALRIAGEKQALSEEIKPEAFHRNERSAGKFVRTIELPTEVQADNVAAEYKNGLLLVSLPKTEEAKPKQITVKVS